MRALITGINGFVGGHLAELLTAQSGWDVWGLAQSPQLRWEKLRERVRMVQADLNNPAQIFSAIETTQPDAIFHLAAQSSVHVSFEQPGATLQTNIFGIFNIFQALLEQKRTTRVLSVGSAEEYGHVSYDDLPLSEAAPLRPVSTYAVSKTAQTLLAYQYAQSHKLDIVCTRPFTHIGPRQEKKFATASFARQIARIEQGLQEPRITVGNLDAQRDFTDVRDIARAYLLAVQHGERGEVYNIGTGQGVALRDVLNQLIAFSKMNVEVIVDPALLRPVDPPLISDARKFRTRTGWEPRYGLAETLHDILDYWRERVRTNPND